MPISREKKAEVIASLKQKLAASPTVVFVGFQGLAVADATLLRKSLKQLGVGLTVAKKTLIKLALGGSKVEGEVPELPGAVALAYQTGDASGEDAALAPAKGVSEFTTKLKDNLKILGGIFDGKFVDAGMMSALAAIPGRQVLYGRLANLLASPYRRLAIALDQISKTKQ